MIYIAFILAYATGSMSFAIVVSKFMRISDPRTYGSQNAGATNVLRSGNKKAAALTLIGDLLKGLAVVMVSRYFFDELIDGGMVVCLCGILAVLGHIYPVFFKFRGGKGVATGIGVMLGLNPYLALLVIITWIVVFKLFKVSSLAALVATMLSPIYAYALMGNNYYFGAVIMIAFFVLYKHKENIIRLVTGKEHKFKKNSSN